MATAVIKDYRRNDLRTNVLWTPYWITSGLIDCAADALDDKYAVLFSFPKVENILVLAIAFQVITAFTVGTTLDIGNPTLATDDITTGGVATTVDDDIYMKNGDITIATPAYYVPIIGTASVFSSNLAAGSMFITPNRIVGAATTVPTISVFVANAGTAIIGQGRVHVLITKLP